MARAVFCAAWILLFARAAAGQGGRTPTSPAVALRDYVHTVWTQHDGMPLGVVGAILQTNDGYLWVLAREHGLLRFDGMRFVVPVTPCKQQVTTLAGAPDGGFWAICGPQLVRRAPTGEFVEIRQSFLPQRPSPSDWLILNREGRPWIFGLGVRSFEPDGSGLREMARPTKGPIRAVAMDSEGTFWASDTRQVVRLDANQHETFALDPVWCLVPARDEGMFALTPERIWRLRKGSKPVAIDSDAGVRFSGADDCVSEAADGALWIGTRQHGVALVQNGRFQTLPDADKLGRMVSSVFVDREGTAWVGASTGLHRFRKPTIQPIPSQERYLAGRPAFAFVDSRGSLWVSPAPNGGVSRSHPNTDTVTLLDSRGHAYWAIGEDATGRIWLSDTQNIGYVANGSFVVVRDSSNVPIEDVSSFRLDSRGQLWAVATGTGVYRIAPGPPRLEIKSPSAAHDFLISDRQGIWIGRSTGGVEQHLDGRTTIHPDEQPNQTDGVPRAIMEDGDSIWITTSRGLRRWRKGRWTTWTREHGLPGTGSTEEIVADQLGFIWIMTTRGLLRMPRAQLDETPDGAPRMLSYARIGVMDGVAPVGGGSVSSPRAFADRNGRLLFTTLDAVITIDPSALMVSSLAPSIVLEAAMVDHRPADMTTVKQFIEPALLQFEYTALSLRSPEYARFRYRLEGHDPDWIDAGSQRRVTYGTLRPGSYRFRVIGAGAESVWNEAGASFSFHIRPVFWRTWWFGLTVLAIAGLMIAGAHRMRVRQLTRHFAMALDARVAERTRIARELHDTLLQTFQGAVIHFQAAANLLPGRPDDAKRTLDGVLDRAGRGIAEARDAVQALRSAEGTPDLAAAIGVLGKELAAEPTNASSCQISVNVQGRPRNLRAVLRDDVYRITSEALRNAVRHAHANEVQVDIHYGDRALQVRVRDDGVGIDPKVLEERDADGHWGLPGMRERAELIGGTLNVRSRLGSGTEIDLSVPATNAYDSPSGGRKLWFRKSTTDARQ